MLKAELEADSISTGTSGETPNPAPTQRRLGKRVMHVLRRGHLYFGLFLFPWAVLYGITAFLFNHPTAFSDQPTVAFEASSLSGTPMEKLPSPGEYADQVIAKLNERQKPAVHYQRKGDARYVGREFAFATVKAEGQTVSLLFDVKNGGGTIRSSNTTPKPEPEKAPFAVGSRGAGAKGGNTKGGGAPKGGMRPEGGGGGSENLKLEGALHERIKASTPVLLERAGFPGGEVTVTSVPDLAFPIEADGRTWTATYNSLTGAVSGSPAEEKAESELSVRRFLLRLHTAHGYPGEQNAKWFWAVIVDVMAFTMCFWGLTGLLMWWQLSATRRLGFLILIVSGAVATALGFAMHSALTQ